jgi:hypothetical protein
MWREGFRQKVLVASSPDINSDGDSRNDSGAEVKINPVGSIEIKGRNNEDEAVVS